MRSLLLRRLLALSLVAVTSLAAGQAVDVTQPASASVVAHNAAGRLASHIAGHTSDGRRVTGTFVPRRFVARDGRLKVRGTVHGVIHNADGTTSRFTRARTLRVRSIDGRSMRSLTPAMRTLTPAAGSCHVLNLVLAPLDLDLLGLQVHLDRVVLTVVAQSGTGNLLGNLLCSITGLLDGGLGGLLGQVRDLLNQILGVLNLGG